MPSPPQMMLFGGTGAPGVSLSISPASQAPSGTTISWVYSNATVTVTGGTATAYLWTFINAFDGTFTIPSGSTTATCSPRVNNVLVGTTATADLQVDVTVGGVHYFATAPMSYQRT